MVSLSLFLYFWVMKAMKFMKWRTLIFGILVFVGLFLFFQSFNLFSYAREEEMQLFIPNWSDILTSMQKAGGFCSVCGQALMQYYPNPWFAIFINSLFITIIGLFWLLIFNKIASRGYNYFLALIPVFFLMKMHLASDYVLDGTIALSIMSVALYVYSRIENPKNSLIYSIVSVVVLFILVGQLATLYGLLLVVLHFSTQKEKWLYIMPACLIGLILTSIGIRMAIFIPITDGIYSRNFQELQLSPDSFVYFVWIRFAIIVFTLLVISFLLKKILWEKRRYKIITVSCVGAMTLLFSNFCLPDSSEVHDRMMNELTYFEVHENWDAIINMHKDKQITNYINLNYLNMALAKKGQLANHLFNYDQRGPAGLLMPWDRSYYTSALLSDIHFMIGDLSLSEGYAMDALTMAKRKGSPRMLKRLVQINLINKNNAVASKYIQMLSEMPVYHQWASKYQSYINNPEKMLQDKELSHKPILDMKNDNLLCMIEMDSLWQMHLTEPVINKTALEYLGCAYLLTKKMDSFKSFISEIANIPEMNPLPIHFQEAAMILATKDTSILKSIPVQANIIQRGTQFERDMQYAKSVPDGISMLYQKYGDTFWFYYYCKSN